MRILYYSPAYHAAHGGRNHAREFVKAAQNHPAIQELQVFPSADEFRGDQTTAAQLANWRSLLVNSNLTVAPRLWRLRDLYYGSLLRQIHMQSPDALHFRHGPHFLQLLRLRQQFPNLTISVEVNASPFDETFSHARPKAFYRRLEKYALQRCDVRFYVSGPLRTRIMGAGGEADIVVPNGVDVARFTRTRPKEEAKLALGVPANNRVIGYVGGMDAFRSLGLLIDAYAGLLSAYPNTTLVMVGDGPDAPALRQKVRTLGLDEQRQVIFTGWVTGETVPRLMEAFDLGVQNNAHPYMSPQKLFEYLSMRLPVVGPNIASVRELFENGRHLLLVENEGESIQHALQTLFNNDALASELADHGHRFVCERFTWQHNADTIIGVWCKKLKSAS